MGMQHAWGRFEILTKFLLKNLKGRDNRIILGQI
jgi:hypothetical protein